ncbi:hypothetical protein IHC39_002450 [Enterococcus faecalis]|nr:hypothetical protein [Enterococcus faecalis]
MQHFFWETSPVYLLKQNPQYKMIKQYNIKEVQFLISEYKKTSKEIKHLINDDKQKPFNDYIYQLLDKEAYLSEIAFYLKEFPWVDGKFGKINYLIRSEYLIDYYNKLEFNFQEKENYPIFMVGLLNNSIISASKKRFSKQNT